MSSMPKALQGIERLPANGPQREALREKGQFWTPEWIADAMVTYALDGGYNDLLDPAVGLGAFFHAARRIEAEQERAIGLHGFEIDPAVVADAARKGLRADDLNCIIVRDFVLQPPQTSYGAIVANPPYIRHHRLPQETKRQLKQIGATTFGAALDGRAGLHIYFLVRALQILKEGGRLSFIMPADTCEGVFSPILWNWIANTFRLDAVVTFAPEATPFPGVDTNPMIFMIANERPEKTFKWVKCLNSHPNALMDWVRSGSRTGDIDICERDLEEGLSTGFSRPPQASRQVAIRTLGDYAEVIRGIATGANNFFFLTKKQLDSLRIPSEFIVHSIGRTRDITESEISRKALDDLEIQGKPTFLLSLDSRPFDQFPSSVQEYLMQGVLQGVHKRPLIATRNPWYKTETRMPPPFLFAYLGRRSSRFIYNKERTVPLSCFHCVYPRSNDAEFTERLWTILRHPDTVANLSLVGKSYGSGAIKVEPRALERLPLPNHVVASSGIDQAGYPVQHRF